MTAFRRFRLALAKIRWGRMACWWSLAFAAVHFFWALGGRVGLDVSAGPELAGDRPQWFVASGLFGVGALLVCAAFIGWQMDRHHTPGRSPRFAWAYRVLGALVGAILLVRGLGLELLMVLGAVAPGGGITAAQIVWTWLLWNPWFVLGGTCFLVAARRSARGAGVVIG